MRLIATTLVTLLVAGCASSPSTPATGTGTSAAAVPAAAIASKPAAATASKSAPAATVANKYPGYKMKQKNGQTFYCKKLAQIGSRFEDETCLSEAEMKSLMEQADSDRGMLRRSQGVCTVTSTNGGCGG